MHTNSKQQSINLKWSIPSIVWVSILVFASSIFSSCNNKKPTTNANTSPVESNDDTLPTTAPSTDQVQANNQLYAWVDKLNIRDSPNLKSKAITSINSNEALEFTGQKSDQKEVIVLRGVAYEDHWLQVITPDGKEGWVFGGAVKKIDQIKGNSTVTDKKFDFPKFGDFDLSGWNDMGVKKREEGDAEITIHTYKSHKQILEITIVEVGDYGYSRTYTLMDNQNNVLKKRVLGFSGDAEPKLLSVTVYDYTGSTPRQFERSQEISKHHSQLNAKPLIVLGDWAEKAMIE